MVYTGLDLDIHRGLFGNVWVGRARPQSRNDRRTDLSELEFAGGLIDSSTTGRTAVRDGPSNSLIAHLVIVLVQDLGSERMGAGPTAGKSKCAIRECLIRARHDLNRIHLGLVDFEK